MTDKLAEVREKIELPLAMKLYKWFRDYPEVTETELSELWEAEEQGFRNVILFRARRIIDQLLNTPITIEGGECDRIGGCMWKMFGFKDCKCGGTGKLDKTKTIKQCIEEAMGG